VIDLLRPAASLLQRVLGGTLFAEELFETRDRIGLFPLHRLLLVLIFSGGDGAVSLPTNGLALDQRRAVTAPRARYRLGHRVKDQQRIVAVHGDAGEPESGGALRDVLDGYGQPRRHRN